MTVCVPHPRAAERSEASQLSDRSDCGISAGLRREPAERSEASKQSHTPGIWTGLADKAPA
jgi:hypothetical protein